MKKVMFWATTSACGAVIGAGVAQGAGYGIKAQGTSSAGTAMAADGGYFMDAASQTSNPALLGKATGSSLSLGLNYLSVNADVKDVQYTNSADVLASINSRQGETSKSDVAGASTIPNISLYHQINDSLVFGFAVNVPWGTKTDYGTDWGGRYHATETQLTGIAFTPSLAYNLNKEWSFGFSLIGQQLSGTLNSAVDFGLITYSGAQQQAAQAGASLPAEQEAALGSQVSNQDGQVKLEASGLGYGGGFGVYWQPTDDLGVGFSYRSQIVHTLKGKVKFEKPGSLSDGVSALFQDDDGETTITTPDIITLGANWKAVDSLTLLGSASLTRWSKFEEIVVKSDGFLASDSRSSITEQKWQDSLFVALGGEYEISDFVVRGGLAFEESAATDKYRTPRTPDANRTLLGLGGKYKLNETMHLDAAYIHYFVDDATLNLKASGTDNNTRGDLKGEYSISADYLSLQYSMHL